MTLWIQAIAGELNSTNNHTSLSSNSNFVSHHTAALISTDGCQLVGAKGLAMEQVGFLLAGGGQLGFVIGQVFGNHGKS